ncbi:FadR family transcriptional regulator [Pseudoclavibacter sp. 8L]|nr:FadR family transcriptional regulator [Pseudoclavibacter sp. 8L]
MRDNGEVPTPPKTEPSAGVPSRLRNAVFQSVADEGKAALVERRLRVAINRGVLQAGERLPPESELAKSLGVSPVTVREALVLLRQRGLVTTKRGRGGGSFVTAGADPASHAADELASISRTALRDLAAHYFAVTGGCLELAAHRAAPSEVEAIRARLTTFSDAVPSDRLVQSTPAQWRHVADDVVVELCALGQSVRLTKEQMRVQSELSPLLGLLAVDDAERESQRSEILGLVDDVARGDAAGARETLRATVSDIVERLEAKRRSLLER